MTANSIPVMDDPLGKYWEQPENMQRVVMDETHVLLSKRQFSTLHEYSSTMPTGVYPGKCWKRQEKRNWLLCWYGEDVDGKCSINWREVLLV